MHDHATTLRAIPLFAEVSDDALARLAAVATHVDVPAGQVLARLDDAGQGMFVVEEGSVSVELRSRTVDLGPGEFFGELALLVPDATRVARVRAAEPSRLLAIGRAEFLALLESEPRMALAMLPVLARRLAETVHAA